MNDIIIIIKKLAKAGVDVYLEGEKLKARALKGQLNSDLSKLIKAHKFSLIEYLKNKAESSVLQKRPKITPFDRKSKFLNTSFAQKRLWFIDQMEEGSTHYNMPSAMHINGDFNVDIAETAFDLIIRRHEILRTVFADKGSGPLQHIHENFNFKILHTDLTSFSADEAGLLIKKKIDEDAQKPFDLAQDLMLRVSYIKLNDNSGILILNMHHIASDGWSIGILVNEFVSFYTTIYKSEDLHLEPLAIQYADYAHWQNHWLKGKELEKQLNYWEKQLSDLPQIHNIPIDFNRPLIQTYNGASYQFSLEAEVLNDLQKIAVDNQATLFMVLHAAFAVLIARYSNNHDVVIGTPVANRLQKELEPLIGFFVNTLVLRTNCSNNPKFIDFLDHVKDINLDAQSNQDVPFEHLVDRLNTVRSTSHNALFQVMFTMNTNEYNELKMPGVSLSPVKKSNKETAKFDLVLIAIPPVNDIDTDLQFSLQFNTSIFSKQTAKKIGNSLIQLLIGVAHNVNEKINSLPIISKQEKNYLINELNATATSYPKHLLIHQLFEEQVEKEPDNIALVFEDQSLSYQELNEKANRLANYLINQGVKPDDIIGICLERSLEMIVAVLGVLKAGGAYLPIDSSYPKQRVNQIILESQLNYIITQNQLLPISQNIKYVFIEEFDFDLGSSENLEINNLTSKNLAYIIYTSGSTGRPKGVMIEHSGLVNLATFQKQYFNIKQENHLLHFASLSFDAATWEWSMALCNGATLYIADNETRHNTDQLEEFLCDHRITHLTLPPALLQHLDENKDYVFEALIVAGEAFDQRLCDKWNSKFKFYNCYGPSESTVCASATRLLNGQKVNIGHAISNHRLYVLGENQQLLPKGSIGELCIGGDGLARGYLNQKQLTAEKFINHSFNGKQIERLYKTGDLVRYLGDDNLEFIGRLDDQVKIRGFRVELGEIESNISSMDEVSESVVLLRENKSKNKQLVAYFTSDSKERGSTLKEKVKQKSINQLPDYMVPSFFIHLDSMPLNINGKIDKKSLPELNIGEMITEEYQAPNNEVETKLCHIWASLLNVPFNKLSVNSNFFNLGGDSILSIQVVSRALKVGLKVSVKQIFEFQTIQLLAPHVTLSEAVIFQGSVKGAMNLLPIHHNFFADETELHHYNQAVLLKTPDDFTPELMKQCFELLFKRHDALRLYFQKNEGLWQSYHREYSDQMLSDSLGYIKLQEAAFDKIKEQAEVFQTSFKLDRAPLIKAVHCTNRTGEVRLLLIIHHLIVDGVSWRILLNDISSLYQQSIEGSKLKLEPKSSSYQQWGDFLREYSQGEQLLNELCYWQKIISTPTPDFKDRLALLDRQQKKTDALSVINFTLAKKTTEKLLTKAQISYKTNINELLLSALLLGLYRWSGDQSIRIDLEGHGREELSDTINLSQTMGWFTTLFPVNLSSDLMDITSVICNVKEQIRAIPNHGIGFGLLKYLTCDENIAQTAPSPILFNYLGQFFNDEKEQSLFTLANENIGNTVSPLRQHQHDINFNGSVNNGCLVFSVSYDSTKYISTEMNQLSANVKESLVDIVNHCVETGQGCFTPSDFPLASVYQSQLNEWQNEHAIEDIYPATAMQKGLLFHSSLDKSAYVTQLMSTIEAGVQLNVFRESWQNILNRHAVLRTVFKLSTSGEMQQVVLNNIDLPWREIQIESLNQENQNIQIENDRKVDKSLGFEIEQGPLLRITVWSLGKGRYQVLLSIHHALIDGWSMPLIFGELMQFYQAGIKKNKPILESIPTFKGYIKWQREQNFDEAIEFWKEELLGIESPTTISESPRKSQNQLNIYKETLDEEVTAEIKLLAKNNQLTVNVILQAAWAYLLSSYSNLKTVVYGTTVSGRPANLKGVEKMVGLFINTVPVRVNIELDQSIIKWLQHLQERQVERNEYAYLPLIEIFQLSGSGKKDHLIENLFVFENYPLGQKSLDAEDEYLFKTSGHTSFEETDNNLSVKASMDTKIHIDFAGQNSCFSEQSLKQLAVHFKNILSEIIRNPADKVSQLTLLSSEERIYQQYLLNDTKADIENDLNLHHCFEQMVEEYPENIAVVFENKSLTYSELNQRANKLCRYLLSHVNMQKGDLIGLCIDRSVDMIVCIIAILKSDGAYLPLDPNYPKERLLHIIKDSCVDVVLTQKHLLNITHGVVSQQVVIDESNSSELINECSAENLPIKKVDQQSLAYVIYTSGSTGKPKGVMLEHRGAVNLARVMQGYFCVSPKNKVLQFASINFDGATWEWMMALLSGATLYICNNECRYDSKKLSNYLISTGITHLTLPPVMLQQLNPDTNFNFEALIVAGESFDQKLSKVWGREYQFYNAYGPTEATVCASISAALRNKVNIGKPISNTHLYVFDDKRQIRAYGLVGELYIGGEGLARGYLNQPDLTKKCFINHVFEDGECKRLYRTGDLVKYLDDGNLEFIGRVDNQVKIRGFRVELGEIEQEILNNKEVLSAVVLMKQNKKGNKYLIAYLKVASLTNQDEIQDKVRSELRKSLPDYMLPSFFVCLTELPMNANGKIDRKKLPETNFSSITKQYLAPSNNHERILVSILADELCLEKSAISMNANFFDIGGNSLSLLNVINQLKNKGFETSIKLFYESESLREVCLTTNNKNSLMTSSCLIKLNSTLSGVPLYLIHPMGGRADCYNQLAMQLEGVAPVYGVQAPFMFDDIIEFDQLSQLANYYMSAIILNQPEGPYRLGGWSIGGLIAQHISHELDKVGKKVDYFIGIDSFMVMVSEQASNEREALQKVVAFIKGQDTLDANFFPPEVLEKSINEQINFSANKLLDKEKDKNTEQLIKGIRFGIDIFKAKINLNLLKNIKTARLFIAEDNNEHDLLLAGWKEGFECKTKKQYLKGGHLDVLEASNIQVLKDIIINDINNI